MNPKDKTLNMLGLALRAGKLIDGTDRALKSFKNYPKKIAFLAKDAGDNIRKKVQDKAKTYQITLNHNYTSDELSNAIGKINRKLLLLTDMAFYKDESSNK